MKFFQTIFFFFLALLCSCSSAPKTTGAQKLFSGETSFVWVMINVNDTDQQGDAHLLLSREGKAVLIDAGEKLQAGEHVLPLLRKEGIKTLDAVFITHPHRDHLGGLIPLLESGEFAIKVIYLGEVSEKRCTKERSSCSWEDIERVKNLANKSNVPIKPHSEWNTFDFGNGAKLEKLLQYEEDALPTERKNMNDFSLIARLTVGNSRVLFTGDLNKPLSEWLVDNSQESFRADVLKFPHHGGESFAVSPFIRAVGAKDFLVPGPKKNWCSERSERARKLATELGAKTYVNGLVGDIVVRFDGNLYAIEGEKAAQGCS